MTGPKPPQDKPVFDDFEDDAPTDPVIRKADLRDLDALLDGDEAAHPSAFLDEDHHHDARALIDDQLDPESFDDEATVVMHADAIVGLAPEADAATVTVMSDAYLGDGAQPEPETILLDELELEAIEAIEAIERPPPGTPPPEPAPLATPPRGLGLGEAPGLDLAASADPETYETRAPVAPIRTPAPRVRKPRPKPRRPLIHRLIGALIGLFALALTVSVAGTLVVGSGYYSAPEALRLEHPLHATLRPGGPVGLLLGVGGTALMTGMLAYSIRKALLRVQWLGPMPLWLAFHIVCGVFGPLLIILHGGMALPTGLIAVGFWCMILVALSGVFGRYVYGHFPKNASGRASGLREARETLTELRAELVAQTPGPAGANLGEAVLLARDLDLEGGSLVGLVRLDLEVRRRGRRIRQILSSAALDPEVRREASRTLMTQLRLKRSVETYDVAAHWLRLWHLFHLPLAKAMYLIAAIHIVEALVFGGALKTLRALVGG